MHRPLIAAHRGASRVARENTVEAFRKARALRADMVELDVRPWEDGLVVHHDPLIDGRPAYAPALDEALHACAPMLVNVEIKNDPREVGFDADGRIAALVVGVLRARPEPLDRWIVSSFDPHQIAAIRRLEPDLATGVLYAQNIFDDATVVAQAVAAGHRALHPHDRLVSVALVDLAHSAGLAVNVWTVDDPERMRELARMRVDCVITNVPDVARRALPTI